MLVFSFCKCEKKNVRLTAWCMIHFQYHFNYNAVVSAPMHLFRELVSLTSASENFLPSHRVLSHKPTVETSELRMDPVAMTGIITIK